MDQNEATVTTASKISDVKSKFPAKIFVATFGMLWLCTLVGVAYLYNQNQELQKQLQSLASEVQQVKVTPAPTADPKQAWTLFENSTYKYTVLLPDGWEAVKQTGDDSVISIKLNSDTSIPMTITAANNTKNRSAEDIANSQSGTASKQQKLLGKNTWLTFENTINPDLPSVTYILVTKNYAYEIGISTRDSDAISLLTEILSTFTLLQDTAEGK